MNRISHSKPWITKEDKDAVEEVLSSGMIIQGKLVEGFEQKVSLYNGCIAGFAFSSATSALIFSLIALGVKEGQEVILPTYVCSAVLSAVLFVGARPVLCDVGEDTWNMSPESVKPHLTKDTACIIAVHIFGIPADINGLKEFGVPVIEDCAQAFGAEYDGDRVGSLADIGVYSFHATKCLTTGEGGMAVARSERMHKKLAQCREKMPQVMSPLTDMQAGLGMNQLKRYNQFLAKRREIAAFYFDNLPEEWTRRLYGLEKGNMFLRFPLYADLNFEYVRKEMDKAGIQVRKGVDALLHRTLNMEDGRFPNSVNCFNHTVSIPIYPSLEKEDLIRICDSLKEII